MNTNLILVIITGITLFIILALVITLLSLKKRVYGLIDDFNDIKGKVDKASTTIDKLDSYIQYIIDLIKKLFPTR
jgi:cell division protein FtsL